jgi:hypothetical protein
MPSPDAPAAEVEAAGVPVPGETTDLTRAGQQFEVSGHHRHRDLATTAGASPLRVLAEVIRIALADPLGVFDDVGALRPIRDIPADLRRAISSIEVDELWEWQGGEGDRKRVLVGYTRKIKFWSKEKTLELLMKHHELLGRAAPEIQDVVDFAVALEAARKRVQLLRGNYGRTAPE